MNHWPHMDVYVSTITQHLFLRCVLSFALIYAIIHPFRSACHSTSPCPYVWGRERRYHATTRVVRVRSQRLNRYVEHPQSTCMIMKLMTIFLIHIHRLPIFLPVNDFILHMEQQACKILFQGCATVIFLLGVFLMLKHGPRLIKISHHEVCT